LTGGAKSVDLGQWIEGNSLPIFATSEGNKTTAQRRYNMSSYKVYSIEPEDLDYQEFYTIKSVKAAALKAAKELDKPILVTCTHKPSYRMDWFTMMPDGTWMTNGLGLKFNN
jgi:hypothetical protein